MLGRIRPIFFSMVIVYGLQLPHVAADAQLLDNLGSDPRHKPAHDTGNALRRRTGDCARRLPARLAIGLGGVVEDAGRLPGEGHRAAGDRAPGRR